MSSYSHRDRVILGLNHEEPDRIPLDLMGNASMLLDKTYLRLRHYLGFPPIPPIRQGSTANYYDVRILEYFDIDFRRIFLNKSPFNKISKHSDGSFTDIWGVRYKVIGPFVNSIEHPLANVEFLSDLESYQWPSAENLYSADGLAEGAKKLYGETDYALVARNPLSEGFLDRPCHLMGMEKFLITLVQAPEIAKYIIYRLLEIYIDVYSMFLDAVGPYVQMVEVADDLGTQDSLIISPQMFRDFIKPAESELYEVIHKKAPDASLFHHTDGAVFDLIPDLIDVGVNVLNPVQTSAWGMEAERLKESFGNSITFHGAIENVEGEITSDEVISEVKNRIDVLAPGGGYVLAPCNHMIDVKPETIISMYKTAREYGVYT
jgi:uroporphyrinogen decarboxylase